jgi:hypothetical protein
LGPSAALHREHLRGRRPVFLEFSYSQSPYTGLPFANDSQALAFTSGDDDFSVENASEAIVISGTLTLTKGDPDSRANAVLLRDTLSRILEGIA